MAEVSAALVRELREKTGAGMMDCKAALSEAGGDMEKAFEVLRKKGLKDIGKRAGKVAAEGAVGMYLHNTGQVAAMVELNCETDFVARGVDFTSLARDLAMQVAAAKPRYLTVEEVPADVLEKEKEILMGQLDEKQRAKADMIIPGRLNKFYEEVVFLEQLYIKDESGKKKVKQLLEELSIKTGEKVGVRRFVRYQVGEGIEKAQADFASEVTSMIK